MTPDGLLVARDGPVHRLPAHAKLVALVAFVAVVVLTPRGWWWALAAQGGLLLAAVAVARLPWRTVAARLVVEAPFVVFALVLPFVAAGPTVRLGPVDVSRAGLEGGATLLVKATIGVLAAVLLASTTAPRALLAGLERLRLPAVLVVILAFMLRYLVLAGEELRRVAVARQARGEGLPGGRRGGGRGPRARGAGGRARLGVVGASVGTRFVRTYERGERVQQAMLARGWTGRAPALATAGASARDWAVALALPLAGVLVLAVAAAAHGVGR